MSVGTETPRLELSLDESAQSVVNWSRNLASYYGGNMVRLNHLFIAFLEQRAALEGCVNEILQTLLRALGTRNEWIDALPRLSVQLENGAPLKASPRRRDAPPEMPLSEDYRGVLERASTLATRLGDEHVGAKHLLISLFSDELKRFREKFLTASSTALMEEARHMAKSIVDSARLDAARVVQGARREADRILEKAESDALRTEVLVRTKEEIVRLVVQRREGWTLSDLSSRLGVSWQSLIWPCRQLVQEGRLRKRGKLYLPPERE